MRKIATLIKIVAQSLLGRKALNSTKNISASGISENRIAMVTLCLGERYSQAMAAGIRSKEEYCRRNGYDLYTGGDDVHDTQRPPAWAKISMVRKYLPNYDYVFFSDADVVIMNDNIRLEDLIHDHMADKDFMLTQDQIGNLNTGNFFIRNCAWAIAFLDQLYAQTEFIDHPWWENKAFIHLHDTDTSVREHVQVITEHNLFNSYLDVKDPLNEATFPANDFLIHLAGFTWEGYSLEQIGDIMNACYDRRHPQ